MTLQALRRRFGRAESLTTVGLLIAVIAVNAALQDGFFSGYTVRSNLLTIVPLALVTVGQTIVIVGGGLDLSVGAIVSLVNVTVAATAGTVGLGPALLLGIAVGLAAGVFNGVCVALLRLQPIIATFASSFVFFGLALWIMPTPGGTLPLSLYDAYAGGFLGIPTTVWLLVAVAAGWLVLRRSRYGKYLYAVGGDEAAAFASGIPVPRVKLIAYTLGGGFAALSALTLSAQIMSGDSRVGASYALLSITAVVIGGTRLSGGAGGVLGSLVGAVVLALITNIIFFANVPSFYQELVSGLIVIAALAGTSLPALRRAT